MAYQEEDALALTEIVNGTANRPCIKQYGEYWLIFRRKYFNDRAALVETEALAISMLEQMEAGDFSGFDANIAELTEAGRRPGDGE